MMAVEVDIDWAEIAGREVLVRTNIAGDPTP